MDEVNRFGDGFLDSLLSYAEEGIVVRRGEEMRIPSVLVATANPPGYDPTAKKLSPPLQARIARAYRVSQPPVEVIVAILREKFGQPGTTVSLAVGFQVAAVVLALWGDPEEKSPGKYYLTPTCRKRMEAAVSLVPELKGALAALSTMVEFGPDARAANDWLDAALGLANRDGSTPVEPGYLLATVCEVLGNKVRENFSEGANPEKVSEKEESIGRVACLMLSDVCRTGSKLRGVFFGLHDAAVRLCPADADHAMHWKKSATLWNGDDGNPGLMGLSAARREQVIGAATKVPAAKEFRPEWRALVTESDQATDAFFDWACRP